LGELHGSFADSRSHLPHLSYAAYRSPSRSPPSSAPPSSPPTASKHSCCTQGCWCWRHAGSSPANTTSPSTSISSPAAAPPAIPGSAPAPAAAAGTCTAPPCKLVAAAGGCPDTSPVTPKPPATPKPPTTRPALPRGRDASVDKSPSPPAAPCPSSSSPSPSQSTPHPPPPPPPPLAPPAVIACWSLLLPRFLAPAAAAALSPEPVIAHPALPPPAPSSGAAISPAGAGSARLISRALRGAWGESEVRVPLSSPPA